MPYLYSKNDLDVPYGYKNSIWIDTDHGFISFVATYSGDYLKLLLSSAATEGNSIRAKIRARVE